MPEIRLRNALDETLVLSNIRVESVSRHELAKCLGGFAFASQVRAENARPQSFELQVAPSPIHSLQQFLCQG